jgi:hypothetical protein
VSNCQVPSKNIPSLGAAPGKLAGTLVFHPSSIDNPRTISSSEIEYAAAWARRRGGDGGLSSDEAADVHFEALHVIATSAASRRPSHEVIRNAIDAVLAGRTASLFIRRSSCAVAEEAWLALRRSLEAREEWVASVKQGVHDASYFKNVKAASDAAVQAAVALGPKGAMQAVRWHFLYGQTESRELQFWQARELQQQQQQLLLQQQHQQQQRHIASKLSKHKQTVYAKRPSLSKVNRPSTSHKKTPPAPAPSAAAVSSDSDILEIPSPPSASSAPLPSKRPSPAVPAPKVSPSKKSAAG